MAKFEVEMAGFKGHNSALNGVHVLDVSLLQWLWAAVTVGTPQMLSLVTNPRFAFLKAVSRGVNTFIQLDFSGTSIRVRSGFETLDQSEKVGASYTTGMVGAKVIACELLDTPHLIHAKAIEATHTLTRKNTKSLADLIGISKSGQWHVIEAKGSQVMPGATKTNKWKAQAKTVSHVNGAAVASNSYVVTLLGNPVIAKAVDPEGDGESIEIQLEGENSLGAVYYQGIYDLLSASIQLALTVAGQRCIVTPVGLDSDSDRVVLVGVEESLLNPRIRQQLPTFESAEETYSYLGRDGIVVATRRFPSKDLFPLLWRNPW